MTVPDSVTLPCGCFINCTMEGDVKTVLVSPCRQDCVYLAQMIGLAAQSDLTVERRMLP